MIGQAYDLKVVPQEVSYHFSKKLFLNEKQLILTKQTKYILKGNDNHLTIKTCKFCRNQFVLQQFLYVVAKKKNAKKQFILQTSPK